MKKTTGLCLVALLLYAVSFAQQPYPVPTDRGNIVYMEYFIDTDPGHGNGTSVPFTPGRDITSVPVNVNIGQLGKAWHRVYFRTRNADGGWSLTTYSIFDNFAVPVYPNAPAAPVNLVEMEYYIDADPGLGNGIKIPLPLSTDLNNISLPVDLTILPHGIHRIVVRSKNNLNQWSFTHFSVFDNTMLQSYPVAAPAGPVTQMEYFIDTDPGFGNGKPISFTGAPDINQLSVDIDLTALSQGQHTLYLRSKEFPWSLSMAMNFSFGAALPVTWLYVRGDSKQQQALLTWATAQEWDTDKFIIEYSTDAKEYSAIGEVNAAGNSNVSKVYNFNWSGLQPGVNYFRIKQLDKNGHYTYSSIIVIPYVDKNTAPVLIPNPVEKFATLLIPSSFEAMQLIVFDAGGKRVWQQTVSDQNSTSLSLQLGHLQKGVYILQCRGKQQNYSIRFVKN